MKLKNLAICIVPVGLLLAACGSDEGSNFNDADVVFVQEMIQHHEQAIEMADLALADSAGASSEVINLAQRIKDAQNSELEMMNGWLEDWDKSMTMGSTSDHSMGDMNTEGMMSDDEMATMGGMMGSEFDMTWSGAMIEHHRGALGMANAIKQDGMNSDVMKLADQIISGQTSEITEMEHMLGK
ncbi:MAG: DUF305 domain-containing protein [Ilumatobacteraceae bacterium]